MHISRKVLSISGGVTAACLLIGLVIWILFFRAKPVPLSEKTQSTRFHITVTENDQPGLGVIKVASTCSDDTLASQGGTFDCVRDSSDGSGLEITSMSYQSFISNKSYGIPLQKVSFERGVGVHIESGKVLEAKISIDSQGVVSMSKVVEGLDVPVNYLGQ